jgi:hypothetical protein
MIPQFAGGLKRDFFTPILLKIILNKEITRTLNKEADEGLNYQTEIMQFSTAADYETASIKYGILTCIILGTQLVRLSLISV